MSEMLFRADAYRKEAPAKVSGINDRGGIEIEGSLFYPTGGGQPGDSGRLEWDGGGCGIATCVKGFDGGIVLVPAEGSELPEPGMEVLQRLDWERRYRHMRIHTALHLLSVVIPLPVTGGSISEEKGRLDFDMPDSPGDKEAIESRLNELIGRDLEVSEDWITDEELEANPGMVKTMSVKPPMGSGRVRLIRIGSGEGQVDLQPCGGTHVRRTSEIGKLQIGKIEKKGRQNRRVNIRFAE